jgi:hypothetical protein
MSEAGVLDMADVIPFEQLIQPDPRILMFVGPITTDSLQELFQGWEIGPRVPEDVKKQFDVARMLFIYGYFVYEFFTLAGFLCVLAVESALMHRFEEYYQRRIRLTKKDQATEAARYEGVYTLLRRGWRVPDDPEFRGGFKSLLLWAGRKGLIESSEAELFAKTLPGIRSDRAHPSFQSISTIGMEHGLIARTVDLVNELFRAP